MLKTLKQLEFLSIDFPPSQTHNISLFPSCFYCNVYAIHVSVLARDTEYCNDLSVHLTSPLE